MTFSFAVNSGALTEKCSLQQLSVTVHVYVISGQGNLWAFVDMKVL